MNKDVKKTALRALTKSLSAALCADEGPQQLLESQAASLAAAFSFLLHDAEDHYDRLPQYALAFRAQHQCRHTINSLERFKTKKEQLLQKELQNHTNELNKLTASEDR